MVCQLDRLNNDLVWLTIVGITDQYLHKHMNNAAYGVCYNEVVNKVNMLNVQGMEGDGSVGSIQVSSEPRFLLYRFWSLYESMVHSEYLVVKFRLMNPNSRNENEM